MRNFGLERSVWFGWIDWKCRVIYFFEINEKYNIFFYICIDKVDIDILCIVKDYYYDVIMF